MTSSMSRRVCLPFAVCLLVPMGASAQKLVTAAGPGSPPTVRVIDASGTDQTFFANDPAFLGGVRVALGDVNGDGVLDIVTSPGPGGGPQVRVWSGADLTEIGGFLAYDAAFAGGVFVATGDVNGDGLADIITGAGAGGSPRVRIWDAASFTEIEGFFAFDQAFSGGVTVAAGDVDGDGVADIVTGAGPGGGPHVRVWNGTTRAEIGSFLAYSPGFGGGVNVAAGDVDGDGRADILTGAGPGDSPRVRAWSGADFTEIGSGFDAYSAGFAGGVTVSLVDLDQDGVSEIVTGPMTGSPLVRLWNSTTFALADEYLAGSGASGIFVSGNNGNRRFVSADTTTFSVGNPGTFTVKTKGGPKPTLTVSGALPAGVTFVDNDDRTGTLAGTPAAGTGGVYPLVFTADNGGTPVTQDFTLLVEPICSTTITITPTVMPDGLYQVAYAGVDFDQSGSSGSSFTWGATGLPAGLTINTSTGAVSGTPTNTVLNGTVVVTVTDNFGCSGTLNTTITVRPFTDNDIYNGGVGHTQFAVGVIGIATPRVFVDDNVKNGDNGPGTVTVTFPATSANGVIAEGPTDGTFVYTPNLNFAGPSDSFVYTLTDGNGVTNNGTVTINLSGLVWYVNSSGGNGDGRSHNPFNTLASASTASAAGSVIYVHTGAATTPGNLTMNANQALHGQGAVFSLNALTIPAGARPTLTGTVTLANTTSVTAVNFTPTGNPALVATGVSQPIAIDQVDVTGGTSALSLTNVSGAVTVTNANFTNTSAAEVLINQGTGNVSVGAVISSNAGRSVDIQNRTGGTVSFTGAITDTSQGILLNANTGSTINFNGGLTLNTGANPAFTATDGGTVTTNSGAINTITTTTGQALLLRGIAGPQTWRSISANGPTTGISVTSVTGGFTVTGTGTAGTGGTIQNATSRGAEFFSTNTISLSFMNFTNNGTAGTGVLSALCADALNQSTTPIATVTSLNCQANVYLQSTATVTLNTVNATLSNAAGIFGNDVNGLTLTNVQATANGDEVLEDGVQLVNPTGAVTVAGGIFRDNASRSFEIQKNSAAAATLTISGGTFGNTTSPTALTTPSTATAADTILAATNGADGASLTTVITGATFAHIFGRAFNSNTEGNTTQDVTFGQAGAGNGNTVSNVSFGTDINGTTSGSVTYSIVNNTFTNTPGTVTSGARTSINARKGLGATGSWIGTISENTIGTEGAAQSGCDTVTCGGISADNGATAGNHDIIITNNAVRHVNGHGIFVSNNPGVATTGTVRARIEGNTLAEPDDGTAGPGGNQGSGVFVATTGAGGVLNVKAGGAVAAEQNEVTGNWGTQNGGTLRGVRLSRGTDTTICIVGKSAPFDSASVGAFLTSQNTGNLGSATQPLAGGGGFTGPACVVP